MAVYLLHFDRPYKHAKHYLGYADDDRLHACIDEHYAATDGDGKGHRLMVVIRAAGISFTLARVWPGADRHTERKLKARSSTRYCPICREATHAEKEQHVSRATNGRHANPRIRRARTIPARRDS